jgi:hypothetical protein
VTLRLVLRTLAARPVRTAVLSGGFGFGVAVMAALLGVGDVILEQSRSPALRGGGDLVVVGRAGDVSSARFLLSSVLGAPPLAARVATVSPTQRRTLFLVEGDRVTRLRARGGIPSLEKAVGDPEVSRAQAWKDAPSDRSWTSPDPGEVLRAMDRFHAIPDAPAWADSWAEWLYFNGRTADGSVRFYLSFMTGPRTRDVGVRGDRRVPPAQRASADCCAPPPRGAAPAGPRDARSTFRASERSAGARLQLEHDGKVESFSRRAVIPEATLLAEAPDLDIAGNRVRLDGLRYHITLDLASERGGPGAKGDITLEAPPGRSVPPFVLRGQAGWLSGYAVPVLSGPMSGALEAGGRTVSLEGALGYHDHNWGFWRGVSWQWGQVTHEGYSFLYGRVWPPADAVSPEQAERIPGVLAVIGPAGPVAFAKGAQIQETSSPHGRPESIQVLAREAGLDVRMDIRVQDVIRTPLGRPGVPSAGPSQFLQLRALYHVTGTAGDRRLDFTALGSAETFAGGRHH